MSVLKFEISTKTWGYILIFLSWFIFITFSFALFISKSTAFQTDIPILLWIKHDYHYFPMVFLFLPVALFIIFWNWGGMKYFRHN